MAILLDSVIKVRIPAPFVLKVKTAARRAGQPVSAWIRALIVAALQRKGK